MSENNKEASKQKDEIIPVEIDMGKLNQMSRRQLYNLARKYGIENYSTLTDHELKFKILSKQTESFGYFFHEGILEILPDGYGFLRNTHNSLLTGNDDVYVSQSQIRRFNLSTGDVVAGQVRPPKEGEKFFALLRVEAVNYQDPETAKDRVSFENLTPVYPNERLILEYENGPLSSRIIDIFSPIGKGQRGLIVAPPKAGKTTLLKDMANSIAKNNPETKRIVLLIDERPEEVTDIRETVDAEVIAAPFDMDPQNQIKVAEMTLNMAKRLVEFGHDVIILMDSLTRLARAYNLYVPPSGKLLSGGVDPSALTFPKKFFGAARRIREGGSLTIIATALVETGSKMDEVIFEEFKGTGNMELILSRELANKRIFPSIDIKLSGTRKEELLFSKEELKYSWILRNWLNNLTKEEAIMEIFRLMRKYETNKKMFKEIEKQKFIN
ncbi:transcription termination factor Rho [Marinitoga sp. 1135]|uniref:Transcription termination factor Rho n=1 Tax=Marinitoga piezophila (strain DSM 14283 / JCM 11233 / KA3) TaxID=443254 RepID=H2J335_MARPK|nr:MULTISPECIES: transcription termination factor Rho [Marinitoga]AEX84553.1 transcription termination factor Rho [Marinitoga piezophila KA3]NUU94852.1 transcription termination factor Rho [Marinitoga sp. 1135]NUU96789.1 transcription termination factor Rho [Marinitoga sp. 1138]